MHRNRVEQSGITIAYRTVLIWLTAAVLAAPLMAQSTAQSAERHGEANLVLPDLNSAKFLGGIGGHTLLLVGLVVSALGFVFGLSIFFRLRRMPVHRSMREVSELIFETCKTYLATQAKFLLLLECFIGSIIAVYFGVLQHFPIYKVAIILGFSVVGIAGSFS